ncbi:Inactive ribonuclease-like protein 9 [Vulpes lagopus]|uniref:inactive ribonuclease-like protein 9 n=1 Tax=Vulpes lagopus TaxID=494514 RepID=UPI001BC99E8E|nr:inactive ribonuclease-like protein 9 [Vulpes lagopus]
MWTLLTMQPLALLLLLMMQPLQFIILKNFGDFTDEKLEEFEDYLGDIHSPGPAKPPTKDTFLRRIIIDPGRPLTDSAYCTEEIKMKNVHDNFSCVREHFFLQIAYEDLQKTCKNLNVPCKNGVKKCHRSKEVIEGVYCNLTRGAKMTDCEYDSFYRQGYVLITCRWQNNIQEIVPVYVDDIMALDNDVKASIYHNAKK